jgi:thiol-disulfide isomerase/thioredoxin
MDWRRKLREWAGVALLSAGVQAAPGLLWSREVKMPEFTGITRWLNTDAPLTRAGLEGKVVLVDFWTYSCINCIRTLPHVTDWHEKYADQGLVIVGVHTPEFDFEKKEANVRAALAKHGIAYPVAMDNAYGTWRAYSNRYWPAHYLMDRRGVLRYRHFGEGNYEETERKIRELLTEGGGTLRASGSLSPAADDLSKVKTPEIYLGFERLSALANRERVQAGRRQTFKDSSTPAAHKFALAGEWRLSAKFASAEAAGARILLTYEADRANVVLDTADGKEALVEVLVDGRPATADNKGTDVVLENGKALLRIREARLYNVARTPAGGRHGLELRFTVPGARAYTFTFG